MSQLDDLLGRFESAPAKSQKEMLDAAKSIVGNPIWTPLPGPQTDAYFSRADELLYGGSGGGGKTDLSLGLAFTAHQRSLILRRKYTNLTGIIDRALKIHGSRTGFNGSPPPSLKTKDGRLIQFAGCQHLGDEQDWQGNPFDLKIFDEATQFLEQMVRFHLGWLRTTTPGQRKRAVLATNPPVDADGDWIIGRYRPWLDITHANPAGHGELRFFATAPDGTDVEVDEDSIGVGKGGRRMVNLAGEDLEVLSRTFIPAKLADNPYLVNTGYKAQLDALPEPLRSAVRDGNFMAARQDAEFQVIPVKWVHEAQARWTERPPSGVAMTAIGLDPAGGGSDKAQLAWHYGGWFDHLVEVKGTADEIGPNMAGLVVKHRKDGCPIGVDVGGGYAGAVTLRLKDNSIDHVPFNGANKSTRRTRDGALSFANKRAEAWWFFRESLDPDQEGGSAVALPPDPELAADLTAPTWELKATGVQIEGKDKLRERLSRSPDKGDAVVIALHTQHLASQRMGRGGGRKPTVVTGRPRRLR